MLFNIINRWLSKIESRNAHTRTHARRYNHHTGMETHTEISQTESAGKPWSNNWQTDTEPGPSKPKKNHWYHTRTWAWSFSDANNPHPPTSGVPFRSPPSLNPSYVHSLRLKENPSANRPARIIRHSTGQLLVCAVVIHCRSRLHVCFVNTVNYLILVSLELCAFFISF